MNIEWMRRYCLSLPHATETLQWEALVFKIGGKIFTIAALEPQKTWLCFKVTPEDFDELVEREGIIQAPYFARHQWVALETEDVLSAAELKRFVRKSYDLVVAKLPKKARAALL
jgi:predicted DNA-binding protein (MmcQ/YjbR family)